MNNRTGIANESETVTSNATQPTTLSEHFQKRKLVWSMFIIIFFIVSMITAPLVVLLRTKTNSEKASTTGSPNETIVYYKNLYMILLNS
ncbi:unnamed protein product [Adineta steineri]|uniref:Uncharacterized protein n=1 Tax=Adineta steineri TaxID=433720 RepID=A0A820NP12_9BILA|nr:unnamed protein product [Adineta steineri]